MTEPEDRRRPPPIGWRDRDDGAAAPRRHLGGPQAWGWWLLPMFLAVGLAGAVLAGSLAIVFSSQRVDRLARETAGARADLVGAVDEVQEAADEALAAIREEVEGVRDVLSTELPFDDATDVGVVHLAVAVEAAPGSDQEEPEPGPLRRRATGFVVAQDGDDAFVVTTFALVSDPRRPGVPLDVEVEVRTGAGGTTATIHSWDEDRDLVLLRARLGAVEPLPWRPADASLAGGERVVAVGLTPGLEPVRVGGTVALADGTAVVTDGPALELLAGGPVVDAEGRVVAVGSVSHRPYGDDPAAVPVRALCERLLARCPD